MDIKEYRKEYYQKNKERILKKQKEYRKNNPEKFKEYQKRNRERHPEYYKKYVKQYYLENKETLLKQNKEYRQTHKEKICKMLIKRRKEVSEELKAKGQIWTYYPKTQRENKMVESLSRKMKISQDYARQLLTRFEWDYKGIVRGKYTCPPERGEQIDESV